MKKISTVLFFSLLAITYSCNKSGGDEAAQMADLMCQTYQISSQMATEKEEAKLVQLKLQRDKISNEIGAMQHKIDEKYKDKVGDTTFMKTFRLKIIEALLKCQYISPEEKAMYENHLAKKKIEHGAN